MLQERRWSMDQVRTLMLLLLSGTLFWLLVESFLWPIPLLGPSPSNVIAQAFDALKDVRERRAYIHGTRIPKIIHQTWKSKHPGSQPHHVRISLYNWRYKNPDFHHILWTDESMETFVKEFYPQAYEWYSFFPRMVMKTDFFRLLVLKSFGGIYTDADTLCLKRPDHWLDNEIAIWQYGEKLLKPNLPIGLIVGLENDVPLEFEDEWPEYFTNPLQIVQWTMASAVNHSVLSDTITRIQDKILQSDLRKLKDEQVTALTGPGPWTEAIHASWAAFGVNWIHLRNFGSKSRVIDDQLILPTVGFAAGTTAIFGPMGSRYPFDRDAKIQHMWKGTWRLGVK